MIITDENSRQLGVGERIAGEVYVRDTNPPSAWRRVSEHDNEYGREVPDGLDLEYRIAIDPVQQVARMFGIETEVGIKALGVSLANMQLLDRKQKDYGSGNIAAFGEYGVLVRVHDKVARLKNLLTNNKTPSNESIEDSWGDTANYSIIAILCRRGEWR